MLHNKAGRADGIARAAPVDAGVASTVVEALLDDAQGAGIDVQNLLFYRNGSLAAELYRWPYFAGRPRVLHSVAKSFTACAIGLALAEGRFRLTDPVVSLFPEYAPSPLDPNLAAMTVRDLLTMRTGHASETSGSRWRGISTSWVAEFFKIPVVHVPGEVYVYTSAASYMLSAILTKTTGETLHDYLRPRLFEPLGIVGEQWDVGPDGIQPGGNGLTCSTLDLMKFGILHLQRGVWNGVRLLPEEWIAEATRPVGDSPYGMHWWAGPDGEFYAMGLFGQLLAVLPRRNAVMVWTSANGGPDVCEGQMLPLLHKYVSSLFPGGIGHTSAQDERLAARTLEMLKPSPLTSVARPRPELRGSMNFEVEENALGIERLELDLSTEECTLRMVDAAGPHAIRMGIDRWIEGETDMPGEQLHHGYRLAPAQVVAGARWTSPDTLEMTWIFADTAFRDTVVCRFAGDLVHLDRSVNVNSGPRRWPELRARRSN